MIWQLVAFACGRRGPALMVIAALALAFSTAVPDSIFSTTMKMGVFFAAGAAIGPRLDRHIASFAHWKSFVVCCGAFGLAVHAIWNVAPIYSWQALPAAIFGMGIIMIVCYWANRTPAKAPLALCGQRSMDIYVMHIMAAAGIRIVLTKAGVENAYALLLIGTAVGVVLPLGVSQALQRTSGVSRGAFRAPRTGVQS
jgi:hypothetical protein